MQFIPELGDEVKIISFAFNNKAGGTGLSNGEHDPKYPLTEAFVKVIKAWEDDECGWRYWGKPLNKELKDYLFENASKQIVYFSQFKVGEK